MQLILTKVLTERERRGHENRREQELARSGDVYRDSDEPGEGNPLPAGSGGATEPLADTQPCVVETTAIRCYYPRHEGRPGTRITFTDGGGFAVTEAFEVIARACGAIPAAEAGSNVTRQ